VVFFFVDVTYPFPSISFASWYFAMKYLSELSLNLAVIKTEDRTCESHVPTHEK